MIENLATACVAALGFLSFTACSSTAPARARPWEAMDRVALDRAYNNSAAVPESAQMFKEWQARSAQVREQHPEHLDLPYGPRERNRIDYFSAGPNTPVLIFFHGGYWQMRSKADFAFLAESFLGQGISVAMVGYPLGPEATMDEIVADAHAVAEAGAFAVVLEMVMSDVAARVTKELEIPTIGIGAGAETDAQVLVWQDMAGMRRGKAPRFVKRYADVATVIEDAARKYAEEVRDGVFPAPEHGFH